MPDLPNKDEDLIFPTPNATFCEWHWREVDREGEVPLIVASVLLCHHALANEEFYETAFRIKNGYGVPEDYEEGDIPDSEKPDHRHMNEALEQFCPICCQLPEEVLEEVKKGEAPEGAK